MKFILERITGERGFFAISHIFHQQVQTNNDDYLEYTQNLDSTLNIIINALSTC